MLCVAAFFSSEQLKSRVCVAFNPVRFPNGIFFYGIEIVLRRALIMLGFSRGSPVGRMECGHLWVRGIRQRSCDFLLICNGGARSGLNKNYEAILLSMGEIEMDY